MGLILDHHEMDESESINYMRNDSFYEKFTFSWKPFEVLVKPSSEEAANNIVRVLQKIFAVYSIICKKQFITELEEMLNLQHSI